MLRIFLVAMTALLSSNALARDECKDVLINKVLDLQAVQYGRDLRVALFAKAAASSNSQENLRIGATVPIEGVPVEGYGDFAKAQKSQMSQSYDLDFALRESGSLLMMSGQKAIIDAWQACMLQKGGGLGMYFSLIGEGERQVFLHLEYLQSPQKVAVQQALTLQHDVFLEGGVVAQAGASCLAKGYTIEPGENCTVQLILPSAWTTLPVVMSFQSTNGVRLDVNEVLLPRVSLAEKSQTIAFDLPDLYAYETYVNNPTQCVDAPDGHVFVEPVRIFAEQAGASIANNSCSSKYVLPQQNRLCVESGIANMPAKADYYCGWHVEARAKTMTWAPPKPKP